MNDELTRKKGQNQPIHCVSAKAEQRVKSTVKAHGEEAGKKSAAKKVCPSKAIAVSSVSGEKGPRLKKAFLLEQYVHIS